MAPSSERDTAQGRASLWIYYGRCYKMQRHARSENFGVELPLQLLITQSKCSTAAAHICVLKSNFRIGCVRVLNGAWGINIVNPAFWGRCSHASAVGHPLNYLDQKMFHSRYRKSVSGNDQVPKPWEYNPWLQTSRIPHHYHLRRLAKQEYTLQLYKDAPESIVILKESVLSIAQLAYTCQSCLGSSFLALVEVL